jgi:hypothetical protein
LEEFLPFLDSIPSKVLIAFQDSKDDRRRKVKGLVAAFD